MWALGNLSVYIIQCSFKTLATHGNHMYFYHSEVHTTPKNESIQMTFFAYILNKVSLRHFFNDTCPVNAHAIMQRYEMFVYKITAQIENTLMWAIRTCN